MGGVKSSLCDCSYKHPKKTPVIHHKREWRPGSFPGISHFLDDLVRMKTSYQMIAVLVLAALVAATPFECPLVPAVIATLRNPHSSWSATPTTSASKAGSTATTTITVRHAHLTSSATRTSALEAGSTATTVTVTISDTVSIPALHTVSITSAPEIGSTVTPDGSANYITIAITNTYGTLLSLSFASNAGGPSPVGNPSATILPNSAFTQYAFPTGWAGRIYVGPNLNPDGSKIEGSYTGPPDVDVSYVDGYSVPITCSSEGIAVAGCNIDLFKQPGISCNNLVDGPVCLNSAQNIADGPAPPFFTACAGAAYTYPNDNEANVSNLKSTLISCCVGTSCKAPSRQSKRHNSLHSERIRIRDVKRHLLGRSTSSPFLLPLAPRLRHRHNVRRSRIHG